MFKEGSIRIPSGCSISGIFSRSGKRIPGDIIVKSIATMHDRSNGLGGGFAGYGIYPEYKDLYALHIFYDDSAAREKTEKFLDAYFDVINLSRIPTAKTPKITDEPLIWRYFVNPLPTKLADSQLDEKEYMVRCVVRVNTEIDGAYVFFKREKYGSVQGGRLSGRRRGILQARRLCRLLLDGARQIPYQYPRLVGRRPSVCPSGLFNRT